ncbi:hypothetical protein KR222_007964, partial [Zaprionus bogoriensis]
MGQRRNAKSVANFVVFLLILQNCGQARTRPEIEQQELLQRRDGLAKFQFSDAPHAEQGEGNAPATAAPPRTGFNFAKIYETFHAQFMLTAAGAQRGRGLRRPQTQLLWEAPELQQPEEEAAPVVVITSRKPFHVLQQLQHDLQQELQKTSTAKPFSVLQHLSADQLEQLRLQQANESFSILQALQVEQERRNQLTTTVKPFHVGQQLAQDLQQQVQAHEQPEAPSSEGAFEVLQPVAIGEPPEQHKAALEQHKAVPAESTRAKDSQKRKRKRIRRRRKRIRRRRKRKRRRNRKQRKKKRKKRKKRKQKGDKDKKRRKRRKKNKKQPKPTDAPIIGQQAQLIFANPTKQPHHNYPHHSDYPPALPTQILQLVTTTKRPTTTQAPFSKLKFLLNHKTLFKKKKKEYLSHVGHVIYPFIKFVAFFTVLNPFTLGVFLFTLISPVVFGFLGFVALSLLVKPFLHLVFGVKENVDAIEHRHRLANARAEQLKLALRPVTIHKHYYQQKPLHSTPPHRYRPLADWRRQG